MANLETKPSWIDRFLSSNFLRVADGIGKLAIFFVMVGWVAEIDDRKTERENQRKEKVYRAFDILAQQTFLQVGGEIPSLALQDLVDEGIGLEGIQLTEGIYQDIQMHGINLFRAWLDEGEFRRVDFSKANLNETYMDDMKFLNSDFSGATFHDALLTNVDFTGSKGLSPSTFKGATVCLNVKLPESLDRDKIDISYEPLRRYLREFPNDFWRELWETCDPKYKPESIK